MSTQHFPGRSRLILPTPWASSHLGAKRHIYHGVEPEVMYPEGLISLSTAHLNHGCTTASSYLQAQAETIHVLLQNSPGCI